MQGLVSAEIVSAIALSIGGLTLINKKDLKSSTKALVYCAIAEILWSLCDATTNIVDGKGLPDVVLYILNYLALMLSCVSFITFSLYCSRLIEERTKFHRWMFWVPVTVFLLTSVYLTVEFFRGSIFAFEEGVRITVNGIPSFCIIVSLVFLAFFPVIALIKHKVLGVRTSLMLAVYGLVPFLTIALNFFFEMEYYTPAAGCLVLLFIIILLENRFAFEREYDYQRQLAGKNTELMQLNEGQEAQIEEITALNTELEDRQILLNQRLAVINATTQRYFCAYVFDINRDHFDEIFGIEEMRRLVGMEGSARMLLDIGWQRMVLPEDRERMRAFHDISKWKDYLNGRDMYNCEYRGVTTGWSRATIFASERDEKGEVAVVVYTIETIHEQKEYEQTLAQQIEKIKGLNVRLLEYNAIVTNAGYGVWHIFIKDGEAPRMQANEKMAELLDIDATNMTEEEIYSSWYDRVEPEELPSVQESVQEMMSGKFSENTYAWNHPKKGRIYVRCGGTSQKQKDGTFVLSGYHADVTELVLREQQYKNRLQEAKSLAERHSSELAEKLDIITSVSKAFNVIYYVDMRDYSFVEIGVNRAGVEEIIGQKGDARKSFEKMYQYLLYPEHLEAMREFTDLTTLNERLKDRSWISHQFCGPVGGWSEGIFIAASRNEDGWCDHIIWATKDIDESKKREIAYQKALEEATDVAKAANEAKTNFLFNMSHDIRTPMNAIMGFRDLLELHQNDPAKREDYLKKIKDASNVLLSIINNVLEMARIEKGTVEMDEKPWSLNQFCESLYDVFDEMMAQKGLNFTKEMHVEHPYVYCDSTKLREIFINILSNAYKYTNPGGSVHLQLNELPCDKPGFAMFRYTIRDSGVGMNEDFIPHIFEEFARENNTTDAKVEGTGLGMPIVKRLVELLGGSIEVYSKKGKGSTFVVTMAHRIAEKVSVVEETDSEPDLSIFEKKRILLAEDNELNAEIAEVILLEAGFLVERAEDGAVCVEKIRNAKAGYYDLVLMDIQMPNMNGYEATTAIRALEDHEKANIKILAMTANAFEEDKRAAFRVGMNGHLAKPIHIEELMKTLANLLS